MKKNNQYKYEIDQDEDEEIQSQNKNSQNNNNSQKQQINLIAQVSQDNPNKPAVARQNNPVQKKKTKKTKKNVSPTLFDYICKCLIFSNSNSQNSDEEDTDLEEKKDNDNENQYNIPPQSKNDRGKKVLVLDLDETLVHSSFQPMKTFDYCLQIKVQGQQFTVYVKKRLGCEDFLLEMQKYYEIFIYTASLSEYADPVIDLIDPHKTVSQRLYRQHCTLYNNVFVKDMTKMNREIRDIIIIDNSEASFLFQPENAIHIKAFFEDMTDHELFRMMPFLQFLAIIYDVRYVMKWLEIFEQAEEQIVYLDQDQNQKIFDKLQILEEFENQFPFKYTNPYMQQQNESYEEPLTNRGESSDDGVEYGEDELDLEDNLESHKGMLKQTTHQQIQSSQKNSKTNSNQKSKKKYENDEIQQNNEEDYEENDLEGQEDDEGEEIQEQQNSDDNEEIDSEINQNQKSQQQDQQSLENIDESQNQLAKKNQELDSNQQMKKYKKINRGGQTTSRKHERQKQMAELYTNNSKIEAEGYTNQFQDFQQGKGKKKGIQISIQDSNGDINYQDSTKHMLQPSFTGFTSQNKYQKTNVKAKEYEDNYQSKLNNSTCDYVMSTQPMEISETIEDIQEAKKKFFQEIKETRLDPNNPINFHSPVAKQNFTVFLSKKAQQNIKNQKIREQQKEKELQLALNAQKQFTSKSKQQDIQQKQNDQENLQEQKQQLQNEGQEEENENKQQLIDSDIQQIQNNQQDDLIEISNVDKEQENI